MFRCVLKILPHLRLCNNGVAQEVMLHNMQHTDFALGKMLSTKHLENNMLHNYYAASSNCCVLYTVLEKRLKGCFDQFWSSQLHSLIIANH